MILNYEYYIEYNRGYCKMCDNKYEYSRRSNEKIALKCLHNSQNITNEFLNEV